MSQWKYFLEDEVLGLKDELILKLDQMRSVAGVPIVITSGLRALDANNAAQGVHDSAHLKGLAADIHCPDSPTRFKLIGAAFQVGFRRIEVANAHIHVDIDPDLPQDVLWLGISH